MVAGPIQTLARAILVDDNPLRAFQYANFLLVKKFDAGAYCTTKDAKLKRVQAAIQGDQLRVTSASKDDLQDAMRVLREQDFGVALQFGNYRG